jgi:hypothetical protein
MLAQRRSAVDLKARAIDTQAALWRALGGGLQTAQVEPMNDRSAAAAIRLQSALAGERAPSAPATAAP